MPLLSTGYRPLASPPRSGLERSDFVPWYDPDGTGAQAKVLFAVLDNHATPSSTDFLVTT